MATSIYLPFGLARIDIIIARCLLHKAHPEMRPPRYSVYRPVLAAPNHIFNVHLLWQDMMFWLWFGWITLTYNNDSLQWCF